MTNSDPKLLDSVALLSGLPKDRLTLVEAASPAVNGLPAGLVGTIVHIYNQTVPPHYLVEFSDHRGCEYAMATMQAQEFLILQYELSVA
jgi:Domain of unknown function (DUF4926)